MTQACPGWRPFPLRPSVGHRKQRPATVRVQGRYDRDTGRPYTGKGSLTKPNITKAFR